MKSYCFSKRARNILAFHKSPKGKLEKKLKILHFSTTHTQPIAPCNNFNPSSQKLRHLIYEGNSNTSSFKPKIKYI